MEKKLSVFDYKKYDLIDEAEINKILKTKRADLVYIKIPPFSASASLSITNPSKKTKKTNSINNRRQPEMKPEKNQKKKTRKKSGQYDYIIKRLSALVGQSILPIKYKEQYIKDREYFRNLANPWRNKTKMKLGQVIDWQIYDIYKYISEKYPHMTKIKRFSLVADIFNEKHKRKINSNKVKEVYWNTSDRLGKYI